MLTLVEFTEYTNGDFMTWRTQIKGSPLIVAHVYCITLYWPYDCSEVLYDN